MTNDQKGKAYLLCANAFRRAGSLGACRLIAFIPIFDRTTVGRRVAIEEARMAIKLLLLLFVQHPARYATMDNIDTAMGGKTSSNVGMANVGNNKRRRRRKEADVAMMGEQRMDCCGGWLVDTIAADGGGDGEDRTFVFALELGSTGAAAAAALFFIASLTVEVPPNEGAVMVGVGVGKEYMMEWEVVDDDVAVPSFEG